MESAKLYRLQIENKPSGYVDVYKNGQCVKRFEGPHAIEEAAKHIDRLREEGSVES